MALCGGTIRARRRLGSNHRLGDCPDRDGPRTADEIGLDPRCRRRLHVAPRSNSCGMSSPSTRAIAMSPSSSRTRSPHPRTVTSAWLRSGGVGMTGRPSRKNLRHRLRLSSSLSCLHRLTWSLSMPPDTLEFEDRSRVLLKEIEALSMLPRTTQRQGRSTAEQADRLDAGGYLLNLTAWQRVLGGAAPEPTDGAGLHLPPVHRVHGDQWRPPVRGRSRHRRWLRQLSGRARADRRPPQGGRRYEAEDLPELRLRASPKGTGRHCAR